MFRDINKLVLNFIWKNRGRRIHKTILKKKNKVGGITLPDFKTPYSHSNQDSMVLADRHMTNGT